MMTSTVKFQCNNGVKYVDRRVSDGCPPPCLPPYPPEPPDRNDTMTESEASKMQWCVGFFHVMHHLVMNVFMTIPLQVGFLASKAKAIRIDNNGICVRPELDRGVACACVSNRHSRSCSVYDICKRRCLATKDRSGACLPILCESDEERWWEATNVEAKRHVDAVRAKRSKNTCQIDRRYRCLMRQITLHLSELVEAEVLKYYQLKRWVYMVRPDLRMKTKEKHPSVEEMLNGFYRHWFDTNDLKKLIEKIKESTTEPLTFIGELESFEREVDLYFSNRMSLHGNGSNGEFKALLCLDPEWSHYPAHELYKLQERACEALERTRRCNFTVYFCTVLKEYVLLTHVEIFIQDLKEAVAKGVNSKDDDLAIPLSIEAAHCESSSALVTGIKPGLVPDTQSVGCSCSQLSHAARAERVPLPAYVKHFIFPRSP